MNSKNEKKNFSIFKSVLDFKSFTTNLNNFKPNPNFKTVTSIIKEKGYKPGSLFPTNIFKGDYNIKNASMTFQNTKQSSEKSSIKTQLINKKDKVTVDLLYGAYKGAWFVSNLSLKAFIISSIIQLGQSPIKSLQQNKMKSGFYIPPVEGGVKAVVKLLYKGFVPGLLGSTKRGGYILSSKELKSKEGKIEESVTKSELEENVESSVSKNEKKMNLNELNWIFWSAVGEVAVSNKREVESQLKKWDKLPPNFDYAKNSNALRFDGAQIKLLMAMVSFACLLVVEDKIAKTLPIKNENLNHTIAGGISGLVSSVVTFPLANFNDFRSLKSEVKDGKLISGSSVILMKEIADLVKSDPKKAMQAFLYNVKGQLPLRMLTTVYIFSIVSGLSSLLGEEPLKKVVPKDLVPSSKNSSGFFNGSNEKKVEESNSNSNDQTPKK